MPRIDVVAIGASAGGVEALTRLCQFLPVAFHPPILIVQHFPENSKSALPDILSRVCNRRCKHAAHGEPIERDTIYIAPPGRHMIVSDGGIRLLKGPKENGNRPAIDPLFRSAARCYRSRLAAVVLSGLLYDGSAGMAIVKSKNGTTIVQDPYEASYGDMPRSALSQVAVDYVARLAEIAKILTDQSGGEELACDSDEADPVQLAEESEMRGNASGFICPECHGALYKDEEDGLLHCHCRAATPTARRNA